MNIQLRPGKPAVAIAEACCHSAPFDGENSIGKVGDGKDVGLCNNGGNALLLRFRRILQMRRASTGATPRDRLLAGQA